MLVIPPHLMLRGNELVRKPWFHTQGKSKSFAKGKGQGKACFDEGKGKGKACNESGGKSECKGRRGRRRREQRLTDQEAEVVEAEARESEEVAKLVEVSKLKADLAAARARRTMLGCEIHVATECEQFLVAHALLMYKQRADESVQQIKALLGEE